jgi:hypothetical protein
VPTHANLASSIPGRAGQLAAPEPVVAAFLTKARTDTDWVMARGLGGRALGPWACGE